LAFAANNNGFNQTMKSICNIYKTGVGPSSSHSMGPRKAAEIFLRLHQDSIHQAKVVLYNSLAATGRGHLTDKAIIEGLHPVKVELDWRPDETLPLHPNGMDFQALDSEGKTIGQWRVYSVGGGDLIDDNGPVEQQGSHHYPHNTISDVLAWCNDNDKSFSHYVYENESYDIDAFLERIWQVMASTIERGLTCGAEYLPGPLKLKRRATEMLKCAHDRIGILRYFNLLEAYALAVAEENASGREVATAPTCGSCGVLPSVLYYSLKHNNVREKDIRRALATGGLFGSLVVERASISGAEVGCQGEIGTACAMAAAAVAQLLGGSPSQVEYAAEMGLEHFLGLTCDPISGLVQVPCIERNAFAATRAYECATYAISTSGEHIVSFDDVVDVMNRTGRDMQCKYRETARGGLAEMMRNQLLSDQDLQ
jgi:L-serine dehydratase